MRVLAMSILASVMLTLACQGGEDTVVVARVSGAPITRGELDFSLAYSRAQSPHAKDSLRSTLHSALEKAIDIKVQELLAVEQGLMIGASYRNFLIEWANENIARQRAKEKNQVVYGPVHFSESAFYQYRFSQVVLRLKEKLAASMFDLSDARIRAWYDSTREGAYRRRDNITLLEVNTPTSDQGELDALRIELATTSDTAALHSRYTCTARFLTVDDQTRSFLSEEDPGVLKLAYTLRTGEVGTCQRAGGERVLLKCIERTPMGYLQLEEVQSLIRSRMIDCAYDDLVRSRRTDARLEVDGLALEHMRNQLTATNR